MGYPEGYFTWIQEKAASCIVGTKKMATVTKKTPPDCIYRLAMVPAIRGSVPKINDWGREGNPTQPWKRLSRGTLCLNYLERNKSPATSDSSDHFQGRGTGL